MSDPNISLSVPAAGLLIPLAGTWRTPPARVIAVPTRIGLSMRWRKDPAGAVIMEWSTGTNDWGATSSTPTSRGAVAADDDWALAAGHTADSATRTHGYTAHENPVARTYLGYWA